MSISERIVKRREELGFTQTALAKRAGLKPPGISQYESGARNPSYEALIKLSNALDVTTDYLISGNEMGFNNINDQTLKMLLKIVDNLSVENKNKLLEYAIFLTQGYYDSNIPVLNDGSNYADYVLKDLDMNKLPIDVYEIAKSLNIIIYKEDIQNEFEGLLINGKEKIIIINEKITNEQRKKFTIATLIGHAIIPWHTKSQYSIRKSGSSTLHTEDVHEIEAQNFAASLIVPKFHLENSIKNEVSIETLKDLATKKYDVSLFVLSNKIVQYSKDKYAVIQSKNHEIIKTFQGNRPLVDRIPSNSEAASFFQNPSIVEEIRKGTLPAKCWLEDATPEEIVYEESIYNPAFGAVLTLLTIK
ncbi:XRE family transcriptional regulator [Clostridium tagluense]|uniref:helix-turn-helix domain-containing protein n=1 Tax=Clostridium tagluense TaxID=360422 RepID=UPI001CF380CA|nr:XRE family transcriptional regulator [Clostridium tagluense]MCB2313252.1 XRE family transcriptional regulator [Clostridium tagluense]MCB2317997.1 XRE family transcriptional regulator [Clostridium tagluense]MCB2322807.1 XRE family transcriptional regulator [Clostridium tagluense]MCB2327781.1 XRE family transcriptional regulator [Clostridium tagluense]MCB2332428.1 XRE family transcriptional regulator [Clostridium tagluense]